MPTHNGRMAQVSDEGSKESIKILQKQLLCYRGACIQQLSERVGSQFIPGKCSNRHAVLSKYCKKEQAAREVTIQQLSEGRFCSKKRKVVPQEESIKRLTEEFSSGI